MLRSPRHLLTGLFCALVFAAPNSREASAMMWRSDIAGLEKKQEGVMKNAGRLLYTPLQVFGGSGVLLGDRWFLTAKHAVSAWKPSLLTIDLPGLDGKHQVKAIHVHPEADLALVELKTVPADAEKMVIYGGVDEAGARVLLGGFGASGPAGKVEASGVFRAGHNRIRSVKEKRATIYFDRPERGDSGNPSNHSNPVDAKVNHVAEPDEAFPAMLDSGSPVFLERVRAPGEWQLMGIVVTATNSASPNYGDRSRCVRLNEVRAWLKETAGL